MHLGISGKRKNIPQGIALALGSVRDWYSSRYCQSVHVQRGLWSESEGIKRYDEGLSHMLYSRFENHMIYYTHLANLVYMLPMKRHAHRAQQQSRILIICSRSANNNMDCRNHSRRISIIQTCQPIPLFHGPFPATHPITTDI